MYETAGSTPKPAQPDLTELIARSAKSGGPDSGRYGKKRGGMSRIRKILLGLVGLAILGGVVGYIGWEQSNPPIQGTVISYTTTGDGVQITFEVDKAAAMSAPTTSLTGDALLVAVTDAMVAFHRRYYHREPVTARTLLLDGELLVCVLGGVYTDVEKTMIEIQRSTMVQETRNAFQNAMQDKFIKAVERLTGRHVLVFMSNHHVGPDMEIELFLLTPNGGFEPGDDVTHEGLRFDVLEVDGNRIEWMAVTFSERPRPPAVDLLAAPEDDVE